MSDKVIHLHGDGLIHDAEIVPCPLQAARDALQRYHEAAEELCRHDPGLLVRVGASGADGGTYAAMAVMRRAAPKLQMLWQGLEAAQRNQWKRR